MQRSKALSTRRNETYRTLRGLSLAAVLFPALLALSSAYAAGRDAGLETDRPPPQFSPLVDYHQHLASPAGVALLNRYPPVVALPPEISKVIEEMARHWNEPAALAPLYTQDALVLSNMAATRPGWARGRNESSQYVGTLFGSPYRITPIAFQSDGRVARMAGYFTRGEGAKERHFAYVLLELVKDDDSTWRIAAETRTFQPKPQYQETISGEQLVAMLDEAHIGRAVLLSDAYWFDSPSMIPPGQSDAELYAQVRSENDWTAEQAALSHGRLVAFCSFNPLKTYAVRELERCARGGKFKGLKLHLQMSEVDLGNPGDVQKARRIFAEANKLRFPILLHAQTKDGYDGKAAQTILNELIAAAPEVPVVIAHLWGGGPFASEPLAVYADAIASGKPRLKNLYFDVAEAALVAGGRPEVVQAIAQAIRRIGPDRILFGSDAVGPTTLPPAKAAAQFRKDVPLTAAEFADIADNLPSFMEAN